MSNLLNRLFVNANQALLVLAVLLVAACSKTPEQSAEAFYERGMQYLAEKNYAKANIELKNAIQLKKDMVGAWRGLSQIEEQNRNPRGLVQILRTIVELDPKDIDARLRLARLLLLGNSLEDALKLINAALELDDRHSAALALKGAVLLRQNDSRGAVREAQKALDIAPDNSEALIVLAAESMARGDAQGALRILEREKPAQTPNLGIQLFKIKIFEQLGDLNKLEALFKSLVELYPQEAGFRRQLVRIYVAQKKPEEAEKELRSLATANPGDVAAGMDVVRLLNTVKGAEAARAELVARTNAGHQTFQYQIALAEFDFARGKIDDSFQFLENLIKSAGTPENVLAAQIKLAQFKLSAKKFDEVERLVSTILGKDSRNIAGLKLRAAIRMERGQLDLAIADLRQALNDQPRATDLMILLAVAYERSGSIDLAEKEYNNATRTSNFDPALGLAYVAFLKRRGSAARAEDILNELAARWPNNAQVLSALANVKLSNQDWAGAEEISKSLRRLGNTQIVADQILGEALIGRNKFDESIQVFQTAYTESPTLVQPMFSLVRAFVRANQTDKAVAFLQDVLKKNPANAEALVLLGSTELLNKTPDEAQKNFKTAIERQPKSMIGYRALANLYIQQQKRDDALEVVHAGLKEIPGNFTLRLLKAGILEMKKDYEGAIAEYDALLKDEPGSMIIANNLASLLTDHRTDKASLDRAYALIPSLQKSQVSHFKDTIGWVQYRRGDYQVALPLLEQAATEMPNSPMVRYHLAMTYIAVGESAKAAEQLQKALTLTPNDKDMQEKIRGAMKQAGIN